MLLIEIGAAVSLWDLLGKGKHSKAPVGVENIAFKGDGDLGFNHVRCRHR